MREVLKNENLKIEVNSMGAELKSLQKKGIEYIWYSREEYWKFCAPILFPIVGTLRDKETIINDKVYKIPQHGIIRTKEFNLIKKTNDELVYLDKYDDETLKLYPFKYQVMISHKIDDDSLTTSLKISNLGEEEMAFNIGGHPAFNVPLYENEKFTDYRVCFDQNETFSSPFVCSNATLDFNKEAMGGKDIKEIKLDKKLFNIDTIILPKVKSRKVRLLNQENKGIEFSFPKFSTLAIWTPFNDAPFVCLEPWIGYNDHNDSNKHFIEKDNIVFLKKDEDFEVSYKIKIID